MLKVSTQCCYLCYVQSTPLVCTLRLQHETTATTGNAWDKQRASESVSLNPDTCLACSIQYLVMAQIAEAVVKHRGISCSRALSHALFYKAPGKRAEQDISGTAL